MINEKIWAVKDGYLVHRDGSIYKLNWKRTGTMRKVKQSKNDGYLVFCCNGKMIKSHRFIANCFIPNPQNLPEINHKDENKTNNCVENLEWCDRSYNINYGTAKQRWAEKQSKKVLQFTKDGEFVKEWCSTMEIERVLGYFHQNISDCCKGKTKSAYKFIWTFEPLTMELITFLTSSLPEY